MVTVNGFSKRKKQVNPLIAKTRLEILAKKCGTKYSLDCKPIQLHSNNKCGYKYQYQFQSITRRKCRESSTTIQDVSATLSCVNIVSSTFFIM
jgi:hypothetical protein